MSKNLVFTFLISTLFIGCIEVRDPEINSAEAYNQETPQESLPDLIVDQPMALYKGHILSEAQLRQLGIENDRALSSPSPLTTLKYRKIIFTKDGVLQIFGNTLSLEAEEIESEGGRIITFSEDAKALENNKGQDGGVVYLYSQFGYGHLDFEMRGEGGGDGKNPEDEAGTIVPINPFCNYIRGKQGFNGQPGGKSGFVQATIQNVPKAFYINIPPYSAPGGRKELGIAPEYKRLGIITTEGCKLISKNLGVNYPTDGHDGTDGASGETQKSTFILPHR